MLKCLRLALASLTLLSASCDYNNDGPPQPDATLPTDMFADAASPPATALDGGSLPGQLDAHVDAARVGDASDANLPLTNESFESALSLVSDQGVLQDIVHAEQSNYFAFVTSGPGFYELRTNSGDFSPDVVISLYDAQQTMIAQNDSGSLWPGDAVDARLVVYLPDAARYYVQVYDPSTSADFFQPGGFNVRYYRLDFRKLEANSKGIAYRSEENLTAVNFERDGDTDYSYVTLVGVMKPGAVDGFALMGLSDSALIGHVLESGTQGNGSTASPGPVQVFDQLDTRLLGQVDGTPAHLELYPPITNGLYAVRVSAPATLAGNAFYAIDLVMLPDNPREQAEQTNGSLAGAEPIAFSNGAPRRGLLLSDVVGSDVDYYSFGMQASGTALVSCEGESAGSGARALHVEIRDASDHTLASAVESANHDYNISSFAAPAAGTYYVRFSSDYVMAAGDAEPWVRCVVFASP